MNDIMNLPNLTIGSISFDILSLLLGVLLGAFIVGRLSLGVGKERYRQQKENLSKLEEEKRILNEKFLVSQQELVRTQTEKSAFQSQIIQHREDLTKIEKKFETQFENLAHKIFDDKSEKFKKQSRDNIDEILKPLKIDLEKFHKKVDDSFGTQAKEQFALKEQIKSIVEANDKISLQAEGLTKALKGDSKTQGDFGEIRLENILEQAGLVKDRDYIKQGESLKIKHTETGSHQRPDFIVKLPDNKHIIVDSKISLTHYERYIVETDENERDKHLRLFKTSVRNHVRELENSRYQDTNKLGTPDLVLMFMPIEGSYTLALESDHSLHSFAWEKRVAIVCTSTLFATLKTINSLWNLDLQNKNAEEIARKGGQLYDKVFGFLEDMEKLGNNMRTLEKTYDGAMNKLSTGRGNILTRTENLKELGAKATKSIPSELIRHENDEQDDDKYKDIKIA